MSRLGSIALALFGLAAVAVGPARADMIIEVNGTQVADVGGNTAANYFCVSCGLAPGWTLSLTAFGEDVLPPGELFDASTVDASAISGAGTLTLQLAETGLTANGVEEFLGTFGGSGVTGTLDVTRNFYIDPNNGTDITGLTAIGTITTTCVNGHCNSSSNFQAFNDTGNGKYSIIEVLTLDPTDGQGGSLSSDDQLDAPEPAALTLFGAALLALAAMRRRKPRSRAQ